MVSGRAKDTQAASTSAMARFETEALSTKENLKHLIDLSGQWIDQAHRYRQLTKLILDMDSSVSETYGHQEGTAYNGYFVCTCYHPLFLFNQFGDLERVLLRRGNHPSVKFWRRVLLPVIERYRGRDIPKFFRGDFDFAKQHIRLVATVTSIPLISGALGVLPPPSGESRLNVLSSLICLITFSACWLLSRKTSN